MRTPPTYLVIVTAFVAVVQERLGFAIVMFKQVVEALAQNPILIIKAPVYEVVKAL